MTEKRLLSGILIEGSLLFILGICMLTLPKVTPISFGFMLYFAFILYGGYKMINSFLMRNFSRHYILDIISGLILLASGIMLFIAPLVNIMLILALIGIYLILESITSFAFGIQTRNLMYMWQLNFIIGLIQFLFGFFVILILPSAALWLVGVFMGINMLVSGLSLINIYIATSYAKIN